MTGATTAATGGGVAATGCTTGAATTGFVLGAASGGAQSLKVSSSATSQ
jgi:hypothetical protein